jgi:hypothetical protein
LCVEEMWQELPAFTRVYARSIAIAYEVMRVVHKRLPALRVGFLRNHKDEPYTRRIGALAPISANYAQILKNSVVFKETTNERIILMKDLAAVEEMLSLGAKLVEGEVAF